MIKSSYIVIIIIWAAFLINSFILGISYLSTPQPSSVLVMSRYHQDNAYASPAFLSVYYANTMLLFLSSLFDPIQRFFSPTTAETRKTITIDIAMYYASVTAAFVAICLTVALQNPSIYMDSTAVSSFIVACVGIPVFGSFVFAFIV